MHLYNAKTYRSFFLFVVLICLTSCQVKNAEPSPRVETSHLPFTKYLNEYTTRKEQVLRVVDGDTIKLKNGETVRYLDIDTPETVHPSKPVECHGPNSSDHNEILVSGKGIYLYIGPNAQDTYGRTLAYVYTDTAFVNGELVSEGSATARSYGQPGELFNELKELQKRAVSENKGQWGKCR